jgi:beta-N-acetylhexosaminidase
MMPAVSAHDRRRRLVRRRRALLAAGALAAFVLGVLLGAGAGGDDDAPPGSDRPAARSPQREAERAVDALSLRQQVGHLVVLRFAGTSPPGYVRRVLREGRAAGAILFQDNITGPEQLRALTRALRRADPSALVCVDQEGGEIRNLPWAPPERSAAEQAAAGTVREDSRAAGEALRAAGIDVALAPVADVPSVTGAALAGRSFSPDPAAAAAAVAESVRGWRAARVAPTAKHFPGLGGATVNTDDGPATIERSAAELQADLEPFRAAIAAGVPLVMAGHALYPALDSERIASQSPAAMALLRERLGFRGVIVTDSLEAAAVQAVSDVQEAAVRSVGAGVDLILTTGRGSYIHVRRALMAAARADPAFRARVRESAARVEALQRAF